VPARLLDEDTADRLGGGEEVAANPTGGLV